jgi:DNA-binding CsgD family transcriptional regulator
MAAVPLVGRSREATLIASLLEGLPGRGAALVVRGEAGIGKSSLLEHAREVAEEGGMVILSAAGVQAETHLPFAGLHQLVRPVLGESHALPELQRDALQAAFGMADESAPDRFVIALASLELLSEAASKSPLLLLVEDAQWLDRPTADVLAFVARRVESDPLVLPAAIRSGYEDTPLGRGLPELNVDPLADADARQLLDGRFPDLVPAVRERLLQEAAGNPLALSDLPLALGREGREGTLMPVRLPLTTRLERAFASRAAELPEMTRTLLRVAAVDDGDDLAEIMRAAEILGGVAPTVETLDPAVEAQLIEVEDSTVTFRHPLVRSAIHQAASVGERHDTHAALAEVLAEDVDRRVWHRAAAAVGTDEVIAEELEEAAGRAQRRGASIQAVAAFERAAALTSKSVHRGSLLLRAATLARDLGRNELAIRLLHKADSIELASEDRAISMWLEDGLVPGVAGDPARVRLLVETAERLNAEGNEGLALQLLSAAAFRCFFAEPGDRARRDVLLAADRVQVAPTDPRLLFIQAYAGPIERGGIVIEALAAVSTDADPDLLHLLGTSANVVGAVDRSSSLLAASAAGIREQGRLGVLARVLVSQAWSAMQLADWSVAIPTAEEARRLARETAQPLWEASANATIAVIAALRDEQAIVESASAEAERVALPAGSTAILAAVQLARGWSALAQGRHVDAYDALRRMFEPGDPSFHRMMRCWAAGDLAEAATHSDNRDDARAVLQELEPLARHTPSSWLRVGLLFARPLLADDDDAEGQFRSALATDLTHWQLYRARLQLAYGEWLRRRRRIAESRAPLRSARDAFDALGTPAWGERARKELRASGETSRRRTPDARDELTAQELQIAQMAAGGLSNREIGQRLYLSHRTIESHLYRIFPKLGITSRAELSSALAG